MKPPKVDRTARTRSLRNALRMPHGLGTWVLRGTLLLSLPLPPAVAQVSRGRVRDASPCTFVQGPVTGTWTRAGSPYCVIGDLTVPASLTIGPGVRVLASQGVTIRVTGTLVVEGDAVSPVSFSSTAPGLSWSGLWFDHGAAGSSLTHCRIQDADDSGVRILDTVVRFTSCEIVGNAKSASSGGGGGGGISASIASGDLVLEDCLVAGNTTGLSSDGGGIWASITSGDLVLLDCEVTDNRASATSGGFGGNGGGISATLADGRLILDRCEVSRNRSEQNPAGAGARSVGGGIRCTAANEVVLTDCRIAQNDCFVYNDFPKLPFQALGGGIYVCGAPLRLTRCIVRGNRAAASYWVPSSSNGFGDAWGGGLFHDGPGDLDVENSVFAGNVTWAAGGLSTVEGGAVWARGPAVSVSNSTLARNQQVLADGYLGLEPFPGAGIHVETGAATATVVNSVVHRNTAAKSAVPVPPSFPPELLDTGIASGIAAGHPITGGPTVTFSNVEGESVGAGNLDAEPLFAGAGTASCAVEIVSASPCVDAGNPHGAYDDTSFPPSLGSARNDQGANGGPLAGGWARWERPSLTLVTSPRPSPCLVPDVDVATSGGAMYRPVGLYVEAIDGTPLSGGPLLVSPPATFCASGRWETRLSLPGGCATSTLTLRSYALDSSGQTVSSDAVVW